MNLTDAFYRIGSSHKVCQDYASIGVMSHAREPYVVVSDGCSGARDTDWGSRILCKMADQWFDTEGNFTGGARIKELKPLLETLNLPKECLAATLLIAKKQGPIIRVWAHGDGSIAGVTHEGEIHIVTIRNKWTKANRGALPAYLSYQMEEMDKLRYIQECENGIREILNENGEVLETREGLDPDIFDFSLETYQTVLLFSDGIESFLDESKNPVPSNSMIRDFCDIKSYCGEFVQRSASYRLKKLAARGWSHYDDLSVAGIHCLKIET